MSQSDLVIRGRRVVTPEGTHPASVHVEGGVIRAVASFDDVPDGARLVEAGEMVVMPGLVDTHVHINEPGRTDWEGFETATRAAAAGGVTTLVEMPLNSRPPTTTVEGLERKIEAARGQCSVDVGFWAGVVPGNTSELQRLHERGVLGFKCFLVPSGVDEFPHVEEEDLRAAMTELARLDALLIVHAEVPGPIEDALEQGGDNNASDPRSYKLSCARARARRKTRPSIWSYARRARRAHALTSFIIRRRTRLRIYVARAPKDCGSRSRRARIISSSLSEEVPDGATEFKCCPPIRESENREKLWAALNEGLIDMVVSDHSPAPPEMKCLETGNFLEAWGGISSLQLRLAVMWTLAQERNFSIDQLARLLSEAPARLVGLEHRKGAIRAGCDADLVIWNRTRHLKSKHTCFTINTSLRPTWVESCAGASKQLTCGAKKFMTAASSRKLLRARFSCEETFDGFCRAD